MPCQLIGLCGGTLKAVNVKALIREWSACYGKAAKRALITGYPLLARFR
jgi:hypothetical protein